MSGPLYINPRTENLSCPGQGLMGQNRSELMAEELPSLNGMAEEDWPDENFACKNEHLLRSRQLGMCNNPYCTTCPTFYNIQAAQRKNSKALGLFDSKFHDALFGDAKGWARRSFSFLSSYVPGVMKPHASLIQRWNQFFYISCLVAIFVDPLFSFPLAVQTEYKCIVLNWTMTTTIVVFRSVTDFIYFLNMLLQFRLAYVAPESRVVGAADFVDHPKAIALHYLSGYFLIDLYVLLPLPQIMILLAIPKFLGLSGANNANNLLRASVFVQYILKLYRLLPLLGDQFAKRFIFESAWKNFAITFLTFILSGHIVGSCWYVLGLQRVNQCLQDACTQSGLKYCKTFIDCSHGENIDEFKLNPEWNSWTNNTSACFDANGSFDYGIYIKAVRLTTKPSIVTRYIYSLFWGFQQISTLAGNQVPSDYEWEVLFTMVIMGLGLVIFALLIGNMQNFLLSFGQSRLEMQRRRRDVEQWMSYRHLPQELRRQVRQAEWFKWAATRGVSEDMLLENLPDDLQIGIRRHLFKFVKKVRIFNIMDDSILDAIRVRLKQNTYIAGSKIFYPGGPVEKMVFIVCGKMESIGEDGIVVPLSEGEVCGEDLLTWCLEHSVGIRDRGRIRMQGSRLLSNRLVRCFSNVDSYVLRAADLEEVIAIFSRFLQNPRVQGAIRYESPYWRRLAATRIQEAWRYRKKRLNRAGNCGQQSRHSVINI